MNYTSTEMPSQAKMNALTIYAAMRKKMKSARHYLAGWGDFFGEDKTHQWFPLLLERIPHAELYCCAWACFRFCCKNILTIICNYTFVCLPLTWNARYFVTFLFTPGVLWCKLYMMFDFLPLVCACGYPLRNPLCILSWCSNGLDGISLLFTWSNGVDGISL